MSNYYDETKPGGSDASMYQSDEDMPTEVMRSKPEPYPPSSTPHEAPRQPYQPMGGYEAPMPGAATEILQKPPSVLAWLAVKSGPRAGKLYRLSGASTSLGRDSHNDIIIDDTAVSRQHAKVRLEKDADDLDRFYLYDLASANGTRVNGEQVVKQALCDNDEVEIGHTTLVFKWIGEPNRETKPEAPPEGDDKRIEFGGE